MTNDARIISKIAADTYSHALENLVGVSNSEELSEFLTVANNVHKFASYKIFSPKAHTLVNNVKAKGGSAAARCFLRGAIALGILRTLNSDRFKKLPKRVMAQQLRQLNRIAEDSRDDYDWLDLDKDLFQKEFGLATLRLYAAGAQILEVHSGVPRSLVFRNGFFSAFPKLISMLHMGGFRPYFQIHTHQFMLDSFNEAGWEECYLCCVELYDIHREILGMQGASWFYDPALQAVSPRLTYLRETPLQNGARLFFYEAGASAIGNSLATSPTRRKLYEEGKYLPKNYMLVWGKKSQKAWARQCLSSHANSVA